MSSLFIRSSATQFLDVSLKCRHNGAPVSSIKWSWQSSPLDALKMAYVSRWFSTSGTSLSGGCEKLCLFLVHAPHVVTANEG